MKARVLPRDRKLSLEELLGEDEGPLQRYSLLREDAPVITITEEFTMDLAVRFCKAVTDCCNKFGQDVVIVEINSMGGDINALMKIMNSLDAANFERVVTYCPSCAYSAGGELLAAGTPGWRIMAPLSSAMIHPLSMSAPSQTIADMGGQVVHFKKLNEMFWKRLAENMGTTPAKLAKLASQHEGNNLWFTPEEALAAKLVDHIGTPEFGLSKELKLIVRK